MMFAGVKRGGPTTGDEKEKDREFAWLGVGKVMREAYSRLLEHIRPPAETVNPGAPFRTRPLNILHVIWSMAPENGGPPVAARNLCEELARRGHSVSLWATGIGIANEEQWVVDGVRTHVFPVGRPATWYYSSSLARALRSGVARFDLVHIHGMWLYPMLVAGQACRLQGVPYIIRPCGMLDRFSLGRKWLKKRIYGVLMERRQLAGAAAVHFTTEREAQRAVLFGTRPRRVVVPNGIDLDNAHGGIVDRKRFRITRGIAGRRYVLYLGRVNWKKGIELLAWAFAEIVREFPDTCLVIAGPDREPYAARLKSQLKGLIGDRVVIFTGHLEGQEKADALSGAEVFVLPSRQENFGIAIAEAMAQGVPVIVSDQVDICDAIEVAEAGFVVPLDAAVISQRLRYLLSDSEEARRMGNRGRQLVLERFDLRVVGEAIERVYYDILRGRDDQNSAVLPPNAEQDLASAQGRD